MPKLTIITINYNNLEGLKKTFESVFMQSLQGFEYIVIDGGSSDGSKEYIEERADKITYWVSEPDRGVYHAMNKGIEVAKGEYVLFINSGDELYEKSTLENAIPQLYGEDMITGNLQFISATNEYLGIGRAQVSFIEMYHDTIWHPSTFIKRKAFEDTQLYDEQLKICSDWKWFLLAIFKYKKSYRKIEHTIAKFYLDGISASTENQSLIRKEREQTFIEYFNFSAIDFIKIDELLNDRKALKVLEGRLDSLKNSKLLKILYQLGIFKAYKYL